MLNSKIKLNLIKSTSGFTLIELLVSIIIVGILASISLPSFLSAANRARETEARQNIAAMNRGQQFYFGENNRFAGTIDDLAIGIETETRNFAYSVGIVSPDSPIVLNNGQSKNTNALRSIVGGVSLDVNSVPVTVLCESESAGGITPGAVVFSLPNRPVCGPNFRNPNS